MFGDYLEDLSYLRIFQHTPGTYQNDPQPRAYEGIPESFGGERGFMGYAPRVCWGSLRS